jgi:hypothetical protein
MHHMGYYNIVKNMEHYISELPKRQQELYYDICDFIVKVNKLTNIGIPYYTNEQRILVCPRKKEYLSEELADALTHLNTIYNNYSEYAKYITVESFHSLFRNTKTFALKNYTTNLYDMLSLYIPHGIPFFGYYNSQYITTSSNNHVRELASHIMDNAYQYVSSGEYDNVLKKSIDKTFKKLSDKTWFYEIVLSKHTDDKVLKKHLDLQIYNSYKDITKMVKLTDKTVCTSSLLVRFVRGKQKVVGIKLLTNETVTTQAVYNMIKSKLTYGVVHVSYDKFKGYRYDNHNKIEIGVHTIIIYNSHHLFIPPVSPSDMKLKPLLQLVNKYEKSQCTKRGVKRKRHTRV